MMKRSIWINICKNKIGTGLQARDMVHVVYQKTMDGSAIAMVLLDTSNLE